MIHQLKQQDILFEEVICGKKTFEVRVNDRNYKEGDYLALNEIDSEKEYTGRSCLVYVDYILEDCPGLLPEGIIVMSVKPCKVFRIQDQSVNWNGAPEEWNCVPIISAGD